MDKYRQERVKRLQKYVSEQGLDAMLVKAVFHYCKASRSTESGRSKTGV